MYPKLYHKEVDSPVAAQTSGSKSTLQELGKFFLPLLFLSKCESPPPAPPPQPAFLNQMHFKDPQRNVLMTIPGSTTALLAGENQLLLYTTENATAAQRRAAESLLASEGATQVGQNPYSHMEQYEFPAGTPTTALTAIMSQLDAMDGVLTAMPNIALSPLREPNPNPERTFPSIWYWIDRLNLPAAWDITTGSTSIPIGIVDQGLAISSNQFVGKSVTQFVHCTHGNGSPYFSLLQLPSSTFSNSPECNDYAPGDHGNAVASIAGSRGDDGILGVGVAWNNPIISVDVHGTQSALTTSIASVDAGIQTAILAGARVINVSQGYAACTDGNCTDADLENKRWSMRLGLANAMLSAHNHDVLVVFGAGDDGLQHDDRWLLPRADVFLSGSLSGYYASNSIWVGASDDQNDPACGENYVTSNPALSLACAALRTFNRCRCVSCTDQPPNNSLGSTGHNLSPNGQIIELAAPGYYISTPQVNGTIPLVGSFGTSLSAPMVTGAAALVMSANPSLSAAQVKQILLDTARPLTSLGGCKDIGHGIPDVAAAITRAIATVGNRDAGVSDAGSDVQTTISPRSVSLSGGLIFSQLPCTSITATSDGNFLIAGGGNYPDDHLLFISKITSSGSVMWTTRIPTSTSYSLNSVVETSDSNYVAITMPSPTLVVKFNNSGNELWLTTISDSSNSIRATSDGGVLITFNDRITKLDSSGTQLWSRQYSMVSPFLDAFESGGNVVAIDLNYSYLFHLVEFDSIGSVTLDRQYPSNPARSFTSLSALRNGDYSFGYFDSTDVLQLIILNSALNERYRFCL